MGFFSTAILAGCLDALRWLLWLAAALLLALIVVQSWRGDADSRPALFLAMALIGALAGWACGFASKRVTATWG